MKYVIIHGHFYQPPRENPSIDIITRQLSASPSHDWNERILEECYAPNAYSRLLDGHGRIVGIVNNYEYMSYNFGPTLIDYIAQKRGDVLERIVEGDKKSIERLGHGNAMAQIYNHIIMPLATKEDMYVQTEWAIVNFMKYFGRMPEGLWLSETAINSDTISVLNKCGIKFVVLSPFQAHYVKDEYGHTIDVTDAQINTSIPYRIYSADGSSILAFFYDARISQAIAFEHLLKDASVFGGRISTAHDSGLAMVNLATDGESYGHHEAFGDMCLSRYFTNIMQSEDISVTNYAHYLSITSQYKEAILHAGHSGRGTSWSCSHGVERWISDCGCNTNAQEGWNQKWRGPMREAFNVLRILQDAVFAQKLGFIADTRQSMRARYIDYIYDNSKIDDIYELCSKDISKEDFILLMEAYKYSVFAFTSCGWFFSDIEGIEPMQNMKYAHMSFELLREFDDLKPMVEVEYKRFCEKLSAAVSNVDGKTGSELFAEIEAEHYSQEHIINHAIISIIAEKGKLNTNDSFDLYGYEIVIEKIDEQPGTLYLVEGIIKHKYMPKKYFSVITNISTDTVENAIKISKNAENVGSAKQVLFSMKDILSDEKTSISSIYFSEQMDAMNKDIFSVMDKLEAFVDIVEKNNIVSDYDFDRIMSALYTPILRKHVEDDGQDSYEKVSTMLAKLRKSNVHISTSGIAIKLEESIYNKLVKLREKYCAELVESILKDVQFATTNEMPIKRNNIENMYYLIIKDNKDDTRLANLKSLGGWLNFDLDKFDYR